MSKQDRQGVRKASDIEQKYDLSLLNSLGEFSKRDNEKISQLSQALSQFIAETNNKIHPIGSVYITLSESDPAELYGGTWELMQEGKFVTGEGTETDTPELTLSDDTCYIWKRIS